MIELPKNRPLVFSGGKLEFRKGQDIVIEAFKRFRQTPEGKDAVLVCAWDNQWPPTMEGIWLSGYVKGIPAVRNGRMDLAPWLIANGLPEGSFIDCGRMTPTEQAHVMRSCTVAIFPNRAESGTNLVLVEALASGLPSWIVEGHGHDDSLEFARRPGFPTAARALPASRKTVPKGCRLYKATEEWSEADPEMLVELLIDHPGVGYGLGRCLPEFADYWGWSTRGPAMAEAIMRGAES